MLAFRELLSFFMDCRVLWKPFFLLVELSKKIFNFVGVFSQKEDERLRAASRRETQQRRIRDRNHLKGLSSSYLDQDMDDDEDLEGSLSAITNRYKQSIKGTFDLFHSSSGVSQRNAS